MSNIPYEEAAKKVHKSAKNFTPITAGMFSNKVLGWVFEVESDKSSLCNYAWMTRDFMVSSDITSMEKATRNLKKFAKDSGSRKNIHVSGTGNATATGNGSAITGISFTEGS